MISGLINLHLWCPTQPKASASAMEFESKAFKSSLSFHGFQGSLAPTKKGTLCFAHVDPCRLVFFCAFGVSVENSHDKHFD